MSCENFCDPPQEAKNTKFGTFSLVPVSRCNSSTELTTTNSSPSSEVQIGIGVPQNLDLETAQSRVLASQFLKRPSLTFSGTQ